MLNKSKFSLAAMLTVAILYVACAVLVAVLPDLSLKLLGWVAHIVNVEKFAGQVNVTASGLIAGLLEVMIYSYVASWIFVGLYNRFNK